MNNTIIRVSGVVLVLAFLIVGCGAIGTNERLREAEEYSRQGDLDRAIAAYESHIGARLALDDRAEWENPWFYLLLIGDLQLRKGEPEVALQTYTKAKEKQIHGSLISDRYRSVASWYETNGELKKASALLEQYREEDPLLFDSMLDRIGKEIVAQEESLNIQGAKP